MKKVLALLLLLVVLIPLYAQYEDSLVSDDFNSGFLSNKWTIFYDDGITGEISFYENTYTLDYYYKTVDEVTKEGEPYLTNDPGISITSVASNAKTFGRYGIERVIPEFLLDKFQNNGYIYFDIPSMYSITNPQVLDGSFNMEVEFDNGDILKYTINNIDYGYFFLQTLIIYKNEEMIYKYEFFLDHYVFDIFRPTYYMQLGIKQINNNEYEIYPDSIIEITGIPTKVRLYSYVEPQLRLTLVDDTYGARVGYFHFYPDLDDFFNVEYQSNLWYRDIGSSIEVNVSNYYDNSGFAGARCILTNNVDYTDTIYSDSNGIALFDNVYTESFEPMILRVEHTDLDYFTEDTISIDYHYIVNYTSKVRTIEYENMGIELLLAIGDLFGVDTFGVPGADVTLSNGFDVETNNVTDANGSVNFYGRTYYTGDIDLTIDYGNFHYEGTITPYMWSMSEEATGPSTGKHIVRDPSTGYLYMVYNQYNPHPDPFVPTRINRVILAESYDEGNTWYLTDIAEGKHPTVDIMGDGTIGIHYDIGIAYMYENAEIPNPTTITNGSIFVEPGSMWSNLYTDELNTAGIKYLGSEDNPYLVYAKFTNETADSAEVDVLIDPNGLLTSSDYLVVPYKTPTICMWYDNKNDIYSPVMAFVDTNWEIIKYNYDSDFNDWVGLQNVSNTSGRSMYPYIDAYGSNVTLVWQEEVSPNDFRIYTENGRFIYDNTETNKEYPRIKKGSYLDYVENDNSVKLLYFTDKLEKVLNIYEGNNIYYPDFEVKRIDRIASTSHIIYSVFAEENNGEYIIKSRRRVFETGQMVLPEFISSFEDTIQVEESALYNYINGNRPIERLSDNINGLNPNKYYEVELESEIRGNNPVLLTIDNVELGLLERGNESVRVLIPSELYTDREINISVDRVKSNPNREVIVKVYEYEEVESEASGAMNNRIQFTENKTLLETTGITTNTLTNGAIKFIVNNSKQREVTITLYDITGREIKEIYNGNMNIGTRELTWDRRDKNGNKISRGVYIYRMETTDKVYQGKIINLQ